MRASLFVSGAAVPQIGDVFKFARKRTRPQFEGHVSNLRDKSIKAEKCGRWQRFRANGRISRLTYAGVEKRASCLRQDAPLVTPVG